MTKLYTSFVIRTKNEEKHIGEVLESLKNQTSQNFEILIVDSGSTDKTLEIVNKYNVKLIKIKPQEFNYSYSLNLGISKARGEIIGILSGHSVPKSKFYLEKALKYFENDKTVGVGGVQYTDESIAEKISNIFLIPVNDWPFFSRKTPKISNSASFIRKAAWKAYPFDENLEHGCEDYDWGIEMLARNFDVLKISDLVVKYYYDSAHHGSFREMLPIWKKINKPIEVKQRPSISYTRIKV